MDKAARVQINLDFMTAYSGLSFRKAAVPFVWKLVLGPCNPFALLLP